MRTVNSKDFKVSICPIRHQKDREQILFDVTVICPDTGAQVHNEVYSLSDFRDMDTDSFIYQDQEFEIVMLDNGDDLIVSIYPEEGYETYENGVKMGVGNCMIADTYQQ